MEIDKRFQTLSASILALKTLKMAFFVSKTRSKTGYFAHFLQKRG
jgi:hypothetical protein